MTIRFGQLPVVASQRLSLALVVAGGLVLAGCASQSGGPSTAVQSGGSVTGPKDTGSFPNLNIKPQNAATQFTEDEKNAKLAQLAAAKSNVQAHPGDPAAVADAAELDKLKASHAKDALKQIGAKCDPALDPTCK